MRASSGSVVRVGSCAPLVPFTEAPRMPMFSHLVREAEAIDHVGLKGCRPRACRHRRGATYRAIGASARRERVRCEHVESFPSRNTARSLLGSKISLYGN